MKCIKKLTCDAMNILKYATSDAVLANIIDLENTTSEKFMKVLARLKLKQDNQYEEQKNIY